MNIKYMMGCGVLLLWGCAAEEQTYYYFEYPGQPTEDVVFSLQRTGGGWEGRFYGTSDEFCDVREGFQPGFFVLDMQHIRRDGDSISFVLDSRGGTYFSQPVDIGLASAEAARAAGYHLWLQFPDQFADSVCFKGRVLPSGSIELHNTKYDQWGGRPREFVPLSRKKVEQLGRRKMDPLDEQDNRKWDNAGAARVLEFYRAWIGLELGAPTDALEQEYLTEGMRKKWRRIAGVTDCDPFIRAQDTSDNMRQSLACRQVDGPWFEVSYRWDEEAEPTVIPVRLFDVDGKLKIAYVTPEWGGEERVYGLFEVSRFEVDDTDAERFVRSFYERYTSEYAAMADTMEQALSRLRQAYCQPRLVARFDSLRQFKLEDEGCGTYDALVGNFDFDVFWRPSLTVGRLDDGRFRVSYQCGDDDELAVIVTLDEVGGHYRLADVEREGD